MRVSHSLLRNGLLTLIAATATLVVVAPAYAFTVGIPEPDTLTIIAVGLIGLAMVRRRRK
jgi:hypothetical protein